ncbi:DNA pilot protein [Microviridae sp.]|nr:DNA pilot protein [Microviridae sp.]
MAFIEAGINAASQQATNAWSAKEAQKNRDFTKEMSSTAHQREVEDMKKAGLNPLLSATGGSGASTPAGSQPNLKSSQLGTDLMNFANSAADTKNKKSQQEVINAQAGALNANIAQTNEQTKGIALDNQLKAEKNAVYSQAYAGVKDVMHDTGTFLDGIGVNPSTALGVGALATKFLPNPFGNVLGKAVSSSGKLLKKFKKKNKGSGVRVQTFGPSGKQSGDSGWSDKTPEHMQGEGVHLWRGHHSSQVSRR